MQPSPVEIGMAANFPVLRSDLELTSSPPPDEHGDAEADGELLRQWQAEFECDRDGSDDWRDEAERMFGFAAGEQWEQADLATMREQNRPVVTFNRVRPVLDTVVGHEIANRQDIMAYARELGDSQVADVATGAIDWCRDGCDLPSEETDAFRSMLICGMGWIGYRMDYLDDPAGRLIGEMVDPLMMWWDHAAEKRNLIDARRIWRGKVVDLETAERSFPGFSPAELDAGWSGLEALDGITQQDGTLIDYRRDGLDWEPDITQVRLIERQWWEVEDLLTIRDPMSGRTKRVLASELRKLAKAMGQGVLGLVQGKQRGKIWKRAIIGSRVLKVTTLEPDGFHYRAITGLRDRNKRCWYGMLRGMEDPQRWANKWHATVMQIMASQSKGGLVYEEDAFVDPEQAARDWAKPNAKIAATPGAVSGGKFIEKPTGQLPPALNELLTFALQSIQDCGGLNDELMGKSTQEVQDPSGVMEYQRQQAGITKLATFFDAMNLYRKQAGRLTLGFIQRFMNDGRLIRLASGEQRQYVQLLLDPDIERYDLVMEEAPTSPNQKERTWQLIQPMLPIMAQMGVPPQIWVEVMRYSPLPAAFADKLQQILAPPEDPEATQRQKQMLELQIREIVAKIAKDEGAAKKAEAGAVLDLAQAQETGQRVQLDALGEARETLNAMRPTELDPNKQAELASHEREGAAGRAHASAEGAAGRAHQAAEGEASRAAAERQVAQRSQQPNR